MPNTGSICRKFPIASSQGSSSPHRSPIFSSVSRIVVLCAVASAVPVRPGRRGPWWHQISCGGSRYDSTKPFCQSTQQNDDRQNPRSPTGERQRTARSRRKLKAPPRIEGLGRGAFGKTAGQAIQQAKALIHLASTQGLKCQLFRFTL